MVGLVGVPDFVVGLVAKAAEEVAVAGALAALLSRVEVVAAERAAGV